MAEGPRNMILQDKTIMDLGEDVRRIADALEAILALAQQASEEEPEEKEPLSDEEIDDVLEEYLENE